MRNLLFAFSFLFLLSCNEERKTLPKSTGSGNEIVLVISDAIWNKYPSKAIKEIFTEDYPGLQQSESFFNIIKILKQPLQIINKYSPDCLFYGNAFFEKIQC